MPQTLLRTTHTDTLLPPVLCGANHHEFASKALALSPVLIGTNRTLASEARQRLRRLRTRGGEWSAGKRGANRKRTWYPCHTSRLTKFRRVFAQLTPVTLSSRLSSSTHARACLPSLAFVARPRSRPLSFSSLKSHFQFSIGCRRHLHLQGNGYGKSFTKQIKLAIAASTSQQLINTEQNNGADFGAATAA